MAHGICELLWLKILLKELEYDYKDSMRLYCDNKAAINIAHNPVQHDQTKPIEIDRHFIKEKLCADYLYTLCEDGEQLARYFDKRSVQ
jgi:hypothetical protein